MELWMELVSHRIAWIVKIVLGINAKNAKIIIIYFLQNAMMFVQIIIMPMMSLESVKAVSQIANDVKTKLIVMNALSIIHIMILLGNV